MTGTSVKNVSMTLGGSLASQTVNVKNASQENFQKIWSSQSGMDRADDGVRDAQTAVRKTPGESLKARDAHRIRTKKETQPDMEQTEEGTVKQPEEVMAVLETAAAGLIQQVAETFDISVEEVQSAMEELGMENLDVLKPAQLGELLLKVGGAEDSYALVTDGELYDAYQTLMHQQKSVVQGVEEELNLEDEQLNEIIQKLQKQTEPMKTEELVQQSIRVENSMEDGGKEAGTATASVPDTVTVSDTEQKAQLENDGENDGREQQQHTADKGETNNLFLQNLKTEQFQPEAEQTVQSTSYWSADTQDIMRQIMDYMKFQVKSDMSDLEMQLHPQSLGTLQIHVASKGGVLTANFVTQNEAVKAALESQMIQLQQNFEEQGIKVNAIEVTVQTHQFERNLDQGRGGNSQNQEPTRKNRIRRINLNDAGSLEEMEMEDALAADMMAAGGGTVDYTA